MPMKKNHPRKVVAVNRSQGFAMLDNDELIPIVNFFDREGSKTEDPSLAVACVARESDDAWHAINLREFDRVRSN